MTEKQKKTKGNQAIRLSGNGNQTLSRPGTEAFDIFDLRLAIAKP